MSGLTSKISPCLSKWGNLALIKNPPVLPGASVSQALQRLNQYTLEIYAQKKALVKGELGKSIPVIIANQNRLSSMYRANRRDVEYIPEEYHLLKALAHIPIAVHTVLELQNTQESIKLYAELEGLFRPYQEIPNAA
ncbi:MAG: hypothetical protein RLZZ453_823 [Chlamydiota bacterium]|jgi:hypothetical protein